MKACSPCFCDGLKKAYKYTQKLSTDVRKRFRQVVNSLGIKIYLIKAGKLFIRIFSVFLRHYFKYVVLRVLKPTLVFELLT